MITCMYINYWFMEEVKMKKLKFSRVMLLCIMLFNLVGCSKATPPVITVGGQEIVVSKSTLGQIMSTNEFKIRGDESLNVKTMEGRTYDFGSVILVDKEDCATFVCLYNTSMNKLPYSDCTIYECWWDFSGNEYAEFKMLVNGHEITPFFTPEDVKTSLSNLKIKKDEENVYENEYGSFSYYSLEFKDGRYWYSFDFRKSPGEEEFSLNNIHITSDFEKSY